MSNPEQPAEWVQDLAHDRLVETTNHNLSSATEAADAAERAREEAARIQNGGSQ